MKNRTMVKKIKSMAGLIMLVISLCSVANMSAKDRTLSNGFSLKASLGFPSSDFGTPGVLPDDMEYGTVLGLEIGNRWYFSPTDTWGIGLMVNWFDISYVKGKSQDFDVYTVDVGFLELGPVGTYALNEAMALDAYYNLRPTVSTTVTNDFDVVTAFAGSGFTHAIGAAFRWKVLSIGVESAFGEVTSDLYYEDGEQMDVGFSETTSNKRFRIIFGFKF